MADGQPEQIGRYRVEEVLGRGAMGVIYRAHDPVIDRKVALKLVRADLLEGDERAEYIARFQQEAQAAGRCAHPNIVAIYDFALHDGNPYLAMEFIDGVTLGQVGKRVEAFATAQVVNLIGQVLDGLGSAHALGVVHRDIKPANIMLTDRGRVKVTDFGISRLNTSSMTGTGAVVGTPSYMSPEQCRGEAVDRRSDLFSTGVLLYEMVTGRKPFDGKSQHEVWHKLLNEAPPDPAALRPGLPGAVLETIARSLAKNPDARFRSAEEMAETLRRADAGSSGDGPARAPDADRTVVWSGSGGSPSAQIDSGVIGTIERSLARYVGPIAHYLTKSAVRRADTVEELCRTLAESIEDSGRRSDFSKDVQVQLAGSLLRTGTVAGTTLSEADLSRAQQALTRFIGPVSRVLVKRAAPGCADLAQLWQRVAQHIDQPAERAAFLKLFDG